MDPSEKNSQDPAFVEFFGQSESEEDYCNYEPKEEYFIDSAADLLEKAKENMGILSYIYELDCILPMGLGIPIGYLTQICGEQGSGRSAFCIKMCISVTMPKMVNGFEGESLYFDFREVMSPELVDKVTTITKRSMEQKIKITDFQLDTQNILQRIHYAKMIRLEEFLLRLDYLDEFLDSHSGIRLIVVDSLITLFYKFSGKSLYRLKHLVEITARLEEMAKKYQLAVMVVNDMTTKYFPEEDTYDFSPALGSYYTQLFFLQIILSRHTDGKIIADVQNNIRSVKGSACFELDH